MFCVPFPSYKLRFWKVMQMGDSILNSEESIAGIDQVCEVCRHCRGPVLKMCGCAQSEFYGGPVHPLGFCTWFKPTISPQQRANET